MGRVILLFSLIGNIWTRLKSGRSCKRGERLFNSVTLTAMRSSSGDKKEGGGAEAEAEESLTVYNTEHTSSFFSILYWEDTEMSCVLKGP